jgi:hypothetical protein
MGEVHLGGIHQHCRVDFILRPNHHIHQRQHRAILYAEGSHVMPLVGAEVYI